MHNAITKSLVLLTALSCLPGCASMAVSNPCPAPVFPTCETLAALEEAPDAVIRQQVESTTVMLKLHDRQPKDEQQKLVKCTKE